MSGKTSKIPWTAKGLLKRFASLKFAVVVLIAIAVLTAIGTFIESEYNAEIAQKLVYKSMPMYFALGTLCVTLIAVMVDRWPWQRHHTGFVLAHIGIILILLGAWITQHYGIDGNLRLESGVKQKFVNIPDTRLQVYATYDGDSYRSIYASDEDFYLKPPKDHPRLISLGDEPLEILDYMPFALAQTKIGSSEVVSDPPAVRFQLENQMINTSQWLTMRSSQSSANIDLGPARIVISKAPVKEQEGNVIAIWPEENKRLGYGIFSAKNKTRKFGFVKPGESVETGWMGLVFRVLDYFPHAKEETKFQKLERPTSISTSALLVKFRGQEYWVGLNSMIRLFSNSVGYILTYQNKVIDLGFDLTLRKFEVGRYQGTMRAASYQSLVEVPGLGLQTIAMNEPLKYQGYTFYQASFEEDPNTGQPTASILSVNRDPGRFLKYLGSFLIVLGTIIMFYFKRRRKQKLAAKGELAA